MKRTVCYLATTILFALLVVTSGCSPVRRVDAGDPVVKPKSTDEKAAKSTADTTPAGSASAAVQGYLSAVKDRRYDDAKHYLSQTSLINLTEAAAEVRISFDQALKQAIDADANDMAQNDIKSFETRNEQTNGDHATVEVKADKAAQFALINLVNESGAWVINIDETAATGAVKPGVRK